jgi:hypothetical protein
MRQRRHWLLLLRQRLESEHHLNVQVAVISGLLLRTGNAGWFSAWDEAAAGCAKSELSFLYY